jgi:hypothetical protein
MFSAIRRRMTYANVAVTLALVFAMTGGAYAANKYLITSTKQISPKVLKSLKGKTGPTGPAGPAGAAGVGTAGATGPQGPAGAGGAKGETGAAGAPGTNGTNGTNGTTGFTETLPSEKTETGVWSFASGKEGSVVAPISFTLPLAKALGENEVHYVGSAGNGSTCPGTVAGPKAEPGNLCVYQSTASGVVFNGPLAQASIVDASVALTGPKLGAATTGALMLFERTAGEEPVGVGTWAVTAP